MTKMELQAYESCHTTVFLYLRLTLFGNGSGSVAHHKTFSGKQSFIDKKNGCELFRKELQEIMDNAVSTTKEATKFGMRLFNGTYPLSLRVKFQYIYVELAKRKSGASQPGCSKPD